MKHPGYVFPALSGQQIFDGYGVFAPEHVDCRCYHCFKQRLGKIWNPVCHGKNFSGREICYQASQRAIDLGKGVCQIGLQGIVHGGLS
jgi:hypothetical protein